MKKIYESIKQSKHILNLAGLILSLFGVGFVINRFYVYQNQVNWSNLNGITITIVIGMSLVYGAANLLLGFAWQNILQYLLTPIPLPQAFQIYGQSQLAKYVPGNIFQFAGRQALGAADGLPNKPLALSILWELSCLAVSGGVFVCLTLPLISGTITAAVGLLFFAIAIAVVLIAASRLFGVPIIRALTSYIVFHIITGSIFTIILISLGSPAQSFHISFVMNMVGAYVVAWLIGLVTPGVPGGVGVREMVLYWFLNGIIPPGDLMIVIVLSRMVTIGGDVLFFLLSFLWKKVPDNNYL